MMAGWIDVSVNLKEGMARWPDYPEVRIEKKLDIDRGDICNVSVLSMGSHTGTHMDAPRHFVKNGKTIDEMPFEAAIGRARVIAIRDPESIKTKELERHGIRAGERLLFKTRNSPRCWKTDVFVEDFVYLSEEAAGYLVQKRVRTVGIDYLSVGGYKADGARIHLALLRAGVWVIEGLNLTGVKPGVYQLVCLPLRIFPGDGAPARAVIRSLKQ
jgi:arylformamidase